MTNDPYGDPDLVTLYDVDNPGGRDHAFYRALADQLDATAVVDLGAAVPGCSLDPSQDQDARWSVWIRAPPCSILLVVSPAQAASAGSWATRQRYPPVADVDLVVCTGNAIQHISTEELAIALLHIASALRPGGVFCFDSRNPSFREWERWTPQATSGERDTPFGHLREWMEVTSVDDGERVVFDAHNVFDDGPVRTFTSELHFRTGQEFTDQLTAAGFTHVDIAGDWEHGPVTDGSTVLVVRAIGS